MTIAMGGDSTQGCLQVVIIGNSTQYIRGHQQQECGHKKTQKNAHDIHMAHSGDGKVGALI